MEIEEPQFICLNYCIPDPDTGACLTCGRPPIPVTPFNPADNGFDQMLKTMTLSAPRGPTGSSGSAD